MKIIYNEKLNQSNVGYHFHVSVAQKVNDFHQTFDNYEVTPLVSLKELASHLNVKNIYVKDESYRFGLNAFKALGGSYSIGKVLSNLLNKDITEITYEYLISKECKEKIGDVTFITATDGNHGRGVAWVAHELNQKSIVFLPKGSAIERLENIRKLGADASIMDMNYDDCVRHAKKIADEKGYVFVQDTTCEGYEEIPLWIMQGYTTMGIEIMNQIKETPTHIFLQAGVGAMSGAMTAFFRDLYPNSKIVIVEPNKADCIYQSALNGEMTFVKGDLDTIMAGLACGEPCSIGWDVLKNEANAYMSVDDSLAAKGMRVLANPLGKDIRIISGESGAAPFGVVVEILQKNKEIQEKLEINENAVILCISTEGDTDKENYRKIVWEGYYPSY